MFQPLNELQKRILAVSTKAKKLVPIAKKKKDSKFVKQLTHTLKVMIQIMRASKKPKPNKHKLEIIVKAHEVKVNQIALKLLGQREPGRGGSGQGGKVRLNLSLYHWLFLALNPKGGVIGLGSASRSGCPSVAAYSSETAEPKHLIFTPEYTISVYRYN